MKKIICILFTCVLLANQNLNLQSKSVDHVIYGVEFVSDSSAYVTLRWSNNNITTPIMIVSWSVDKSNTVTVKYKQGSSIVGGFEKRLISGEGIHFPTVILLEEDLGQATTKQPIFSDLPQSSEGKLSISHLYDKGIINGYTDGTFKPSGQVSRAEFSKMLFLAGEMTYDLSSKTTFTDVASTHWAKDYILTLSSKKIVNGKGNNTFDPSGTITVGEVLAVLDRNFTLEDKAAVYPYTLVDHWSNPFFTSLVSKKIVLSSDSFYKPYTPNRPATRMECAIVLSRILRTYYTSK